VRLRGVVLSATCRRTQGTSSIGRTRHYAVDRTFYDAIKLIMD